jgi:hypothetical protein
MKIWGCVVAVLLLASSAVPASALNWSAGANLGIAFDSPTDDALESTTTFGWPFSGTMPGLRFGFTGASPTHEFYIDTGLNYSSTKDVTTTRSFIGTGNYQYNFGSSGNLSPYLTAGAGFVMVGFKDETDPDDVLDISANSAIFGGGVGIRHKMGNGHGTMRAEVRYDRTTEGKDEIGGVEIPIIPETSIITLKFGFDLWDTK